MATRTPPTVLVMCLSQLDSDPRVLKQIEWLSKAGWRVDTLGMGGRPSASVRNHFEISPKTLFRKFSSAFILLMPFGVFSFKKFSASTIPTRLFRRLGKEKYTNIVVNDIDLLGLATSISEEQSKLNNNLRLHLDLHEFHTWTSNSHYPILSKKLENYHSWLCSLISSKAITSISTVNSGIAELYKQQYEITMPAVIRNSKTLLVLKPSIVDPENIRLVYHGYAELSRGLKELIESSAHLEKRFSLSLMLTGNAAVIQQLKDLANKHNPNINFVNSVPMDLVSQTLNAFDVSLAFFPPVNQSFLYALPNKFFEAIQARIPIVAGESPEMASLIRNFKLGWIVKDWQYESLISLINSLSIEEINLAKQNVDKSSKEFSSDTDREAFMRCMSSFYNNKGELTSQ